MGLFDKKAHKEEKPIQKKRKNTPTHFGNVQEENRRNLGFYSYNIRKTNINRYP